MTITDGLGEPPYTEEQWRTVSSTFPAGADEQKFGTELLTEALCLHLQLYALPPQYGKDLRRIASAARRFNKAVTTTEASLLIAPLSRLVMGLPELAESIDRVADFFEVDVHKMRPSNNMDVERDVYLRRLLKLWVSGNGELKTSNRNGAAGPLIQFLFAAAGPPLEAMGMKKPTKEAAGICPEGSP